MELHNPPRLGLPPLMIEKQSSRVDIEQSSDIAAFNNSNLLLDKQFHALFMQITNKSADIERIIKDREKGQLEYQWVPLTERERIAKLHHHYIVKLPQGQFSLSTSVKGLPRRRYVNQIIGFLPKTGIRNMPFEQENARLSLNVLFSAEFSERNVTVRDNLIQAHPCSL